MTNTPASHAFLAAPRRTLLRMAVAVSISLIAEPLTGLADTAFVARLGTVPLAGLGIGAMVLSSAFWVFNFLGVGTQTELARCMGAGDSFRASQILSASLLLAAGLGITVALAAWPAAETAARLLGGDGPVLQNAVDYIRVRLLGAPAILLTFSCFGALRGMQNMRTPLWIAGAVNLLNIVLDWLFIFGNGPFPAMGVTGAGLATSVSQWLGAMWAIWLVRHHIGIASNPRRADIRALLSIGGDLFVRTGMVLAFLLLATRQATEAGPDCGAAHQAIRQFFLFSALFLDAFAITGQSLIGYFMGSSAIPAARQVAGMVCRWSLGTGTLLMIAMLLLEEPIAWLLIPPGIHSTFATGWLVASLIQPINALSFATDGIHWGTGDFRYLRNAMLISSLGGMALLLATSAVNAQPPLLWIWLATGLWTMLRTIFGVWRIWPGGRNAPLHRAPRPLAS